MRRYGAFRANLVGYLRLFAKSRSHFWLWPRCGGQDDKRAVAISSGAKESSLIKSRGLAQFAKLAFELASLPSLRLGVLA